MLGILNKQILEQLNLLSAIVLGWAGFLIGLQTDIKGLRRFQRSHYFFASSNFVLTLLVTVILFLVMNRWLPGYIGILDIVILAVAGAVTSPILIAIIAKDYRISGSISYVLRFNAAFDNILGVLVTGFFFAYYSKFSLVMNPVLNMSMIVGIFILSIGLSRIYYYLSKELRSEQEDTLMVISLLLVLMGAALLLNQSLLFGAFVFGAGLANLPISTKKLYLDIQNFEKPLYILLLFFVGANLDFKNESYMILLLLFLIIHIMAKVFAGVVSYTFIRNETPHIHRSIGLGNLGMGGLSLAIILDVHLHRLTENSNMLLFILTISIVINDLISLWYLKKKTI